MKHVQAVLHRMSLNRPPFGVRDPACHVVRLAVEIQKVAFFSHGPYGFALGE